MSVKMRFTSDNKVLLVGSLIENKNNIELKPGGDLHVKEFIDKAKGFDTADLVDDGTRLVQTETEMDFEYGYEFLEWFFNLTSKNLNVNFIRFEQGKYLLANELRENENL